MNTVVGCKFYKYLDEDTLEIVRLLKIKNKDCFVVVDENMENKRNLTKRELDEYTKLNPDGFITFSIVGLDHGTKDVIVTLHRKKDLDGGAVIPYCVCRQNIFDLFSSQIIKEPGVTYIGTTMSVENVPPDTEYNVMLMCNSVIESFIVNIYMTDTLDIVMKFFNPLNFNELLKKMYDAFSKSDSEEESKEKFRGQCSTLLQLLQENHFWNEFNRAYGIIKLPYKVEKLTLSIDQIDYIEKILKHKMYNIQVIKYAKDIILDKIKVNYILVSDKNNVMYLLCYNEGEYANDAYLSNEEVGQLLRDKI